MKHAGHIVLVAALTLATMAAGATPPQHTPAKLSMAQARQLALKVYPGKIVKEELENESGGSGLRYSFDVSNGKVTHEVGIDAHSGKVLENSVEGDND